MNKGQVYIFFDDIMREYQNHYGEFFENVVIEDLKKYLSGFSINSEIMIITGNDIVLVTNWFVKNDLFKFINTISP